MQEYPMRERIYLPITKFGVPHTDWKWVLIVTMIAFVLPAWNAEGVTGEEVTGEGVTGCWQF